MRTVHGLKMQVLKLSLIILAFLSFVAEAKTLKVDTVTPSVTDGDFTITPNGTGDIVLGSSTGFVKLTSGVLSNQEFIGLASEISGVLPVANGGTGSSTRNYVDLVSTETIAGVKTFSSDVLMSGTGQIGVASGTTAQRSGTPSDGMFRHNSDLNQFEGYNDGAWGAVGGAGGGGGINYIKLGGVDAEADIGDWVTYLDVAGVNPVDGVGGTAAITFAQNSTTPLRGTKDFKLVKDAANRQGNGISIPFTIDLADKAQILTISFDYDASHVGYADDDVRVSVYDVTNSQLIRISGEDLKGGKNTHYARFQTASDSVSYRLILHISSTSAAAYDLLFDEFKVGPQIIQRGAIVGDWETYTPVIYEGNIDRTSEFQVNTARYRRVGDSVEISWSGQRNTSASVGGGSSFFVALPEGISGNPIAPRDGEGVYFSSDNALFQGVAQLGSNSPRPDAVMWVIERFAAFPRVYNNTNFAPSTHHKIHGFTIPIQGWNSQAEMSSDFGGRDVVVRGAGNSGAAITANTEAIDFTVIEDSTASWSQVGAHGKDTFTAPETGIYAISGGVAFTASSSLDIEVYLDNTRVKRIGKLVSASDGIISTTLKIEKGQLLTIRTTSLKTLDNDIFKHHISIVKLATPQTQLQSETVAARYTSNRGHTFSSVTALNYENKDYDTHNAYNSSTGVYTVPAGMGGKYRIKAIYRTQASTWSVGNIVSIRIVTAGDNPRVITPVVSTTSIAYMVSIDETLSLDGGDTFSVSGFNSQDVSMNTSTAYNSISIERVK